MLTNLLLVQADPELREALRFGFEREGIEVIAAGDDGAIPEGVAELRPQVVIAGAGSADEGISTLGRIAAALAEASLEAPVLYLGNGISRAQARAEGAAEVIDSPVFVRDVVTLGRLLATGAEGEPDLMRGTLGDHFGLFYLVRALAAAQTQCVLTLVRGLRRGELRFFDGEVTSAQVGDLHGLAALHQLLLWTDAHLEVSREEVTRRRQIPLEPAELIERAERFLEEVEEVSGGVSPVGVYEPSAALSKAARQTLPAPIEGVLELFDGRRILAEVVEDSKFRLFETLRIARRLLEVGFIEQRGKGDAAESKKKKKGKKGREAKPDADSEEAAGTEIDWSDVMPGDPAESGGVTGVVPSSAAAGEIGGEPDLHPVGEPDEQASDEIAAKTSRPRRRRRRSSIEIDENMLNEAAARGEAVEVGGEPEEEAEPAAEAQAEPEPAAEAEPAAVADAVPEPVGAAPSGSFSEAEEAFFAAGHELATAKPDPVESFDDLDEDYEVPRSFWQRLLRRPGQKPQRRDKERKAKKAQPKKPQSKKPRSKKR